MRRVIVISGIVVLVAVIAFLAIKYFPSKPQQPILQTFSTKQNPAFKAVPQKCPLIIEVKNTEGLYQKLKGDNSIVKELKGIPEVQSLFAKIGRFSDFIGNHSQINNLLKGKSILVSVNLAGKNQMATLFLAQMNNSAESNSATEVISRDLGSGYTISRRNYDNTTIMNARSAESDFYFACTNDVLMASEDFILLEQSIRQANSANLLDNREFTELYKTIEETAIANIFINHQTIHQLLAKYVAPELRKTIGQLNAWSNWTGLDLNLNPSEIDLSGYSVTKDSTDNYLNIFRSQKAGKITIEKAIPANASYFVALNLFNVSSYINQYETYLKTNGAFYPREMNLMEFQKKTKTDASVLFKEIGGTQFAGVYTNINKSNPLQNRFFVAEIKNVSDARGKIEKAVSEFKLTDKSGDGKYQTEYVADSKNSFDIYRLPVHNMAESLFGRAFSGISGEYLTIYDKYLIWGDNLPGLKNYLQSLASAKTLANDSVYKVSVKSGQPNANFYLYAKVPKVFSLKDVLLRPELSTSISANEEVFRKFSTLRWQFTISDQMVKNQVSLKYEPNLKEEPQAIWQLKLDAPLVDKPRMVLNHKDPANRELILCDKQNNIYLINKEGTILWKLNLPEELMSEIYQIDLYRNNRFQYMFNTKTQLYVIDRMGNKVGKYPVTLKSMAANGVSVAEYGQNKEYRFFIAGEDRKIYVYDRDGKLIPKWNFEGTETQVTQPIRHLEVEGKDYIIVSDKKNTYFLDRQGKTREGQPAPFNRSGNPLYIPDDGNPKIISTDLAGKIHIEDFSGQAEIREIGKFGAGHRFTVGDIDVNGSLEYLFAEGKKLTVFAQDGKKLFDRSFPDAISEIPFVCQMGNGVNKIGVVVEAQNKIYLLDKNGAIIRGFPLAGNTPFILGKFNDTSSYFNLIVGSDDGTLVNYKIE
jgi:hypothetical protein